MHDRVRSEPEPPVSLRYHQFRGRLGMGDLHPGGAPATAKILGWLRERGVREVLEVGAGIGNTAARMRSLGWQVTAIEPDSILFARLRKRLGTSAHRVPFLEHVPTTLYDAIVAESVFFQMDLSQAFAHAGALLRPGGYLAFSEALWSEGTTAAKSAELHELTQRLFGIPVGSRDPLTQRHWRRHLQDAGFEIVHAELLPAGSAGYPPTANWRQALAAMARDPRLAIWMMRFQLRKRLARMPPGSQESWVFLAKTAHVL